MFLPNLHVNLNIDFDIGEILIMKTCYLNDSYFFSYLPLVSNVMLTDYCTLLSFVRKSSILSK